MKARFTEKQNPVTWNTLPDGKVDVMICLNENTVTETYSGGDPENPEHIEQTVYEYDFNQFREDQKKISEETVRASPGKYLKYIPATEKSTEQLLAEQSEQIEMLKDCLLEMSEQVYALKLNYNAIEQRRQRNDGEVMGY